MGISASFFKPLVTVISLAVGICLPLAAVAADIEELMAQLADPTNENWQAVEHQIRTEWSRSGSAAMDLLLQRGQKALEAGKYELALEHFTALTDHAPDFAEGWNGRATALFRLKLYGPAIEDIGKTLALNPRHFGAISGLAVILQELGYQKDALAAWRLLRAIHPHLPDLKDAIEQLETETGGVRL